MADHHQRTRQRRPSTRLLARLGLCLVAAAIISLPLALERGVERTQIRDSIGLVPARLALTGSSDSELRLGLLGTIRFPVSRGPIGMSVIADGPPTSPDGGHGIASYVSPQMLQVYGGLFHDPGKAIRGYVDQLGDELQRQVLLAEVFYSLVGAGVLMVATYLVDPGLVDRLVARPWRTTGLGVTVGLLASAGVAYVGFWQWAAASGDVSSVAYPLPSLDGTPAEGAVTDSPVLRLAIEDAVPKIESLVDRQELRTRAYTAAAAAQLRALQRDMAAPRAGELAVMMQSDMHCNATMIALQRRVVELLDARYGQDTVSLLAISGDLSTNGTAAEGGCVADEAAVVGGAPVAAVTGNHDSETTVRQMKTAGMKVLTGSTETLAGTRVLGAGDPNRTELFGPTAPRGDQTEESVGAATYRTAVADHPDLVLLHEGYAVQSFLGSGVSDMRAFLDQRGSPTRWWADDVRDLPTGAVFYGHWHRDVPPRVVWNSDGSWTLVMELNTSGGAIASPTLNHFSTPWSQPQQLASFPMVFRSRDSGLVTGYQLYSFAPDGTVRISPRIDVGDPGGRAVPPGR